MLKTFVEEPLCAVFQKVSKSEKAYGSEAPRRVSSFSVENFSSDSAETFRWKPFSVSLISGIEKVWLRGGGGVGVSRFSVENFCLRVLKTFVEEPLCAVFEKVSKSEKVYGSKAGRRVSSFSLENFLSHSAEKCRRRTLLRCVSENFRQRKSLSIRGEERGISSFAVDFFCLTVPKSFVQERFSVSLISGIENF